MGIWMHNLRIQHRHWQHPPACSKDRAWNPVFCRKSCGTLVITSRIRSSNCSNVLDFARYTSSLAQPQRKKSQGVRSGLLAGHSCGPRRPSQRSGNLIQPGTYAQCKVWWCAIVHENKFIDVFPARL